eukprot:7391435-Prymnesium_polylepis.1
MEIFRSADRDMSGMLSEDELKKVLRNSSSIASDASVRLWLVSEEDGPLVWLEPAMFVEDICREKPLPERSLHADVLNEVKGLHSSLPGQGCVALPITDYRLE